MWRATCVKAVVVAAPPIAVARPLATHITPVTTATAAITLTLLAHPATAREHFLHTARPALAATATHCTRSHRFVSQSLSTAATQQRRTMSISEADAARGCIYGALVGDALGSFLEFSHDVSAEAVEKAMTMPGGGCFNTIAGQPTDDGEQTICLLRALAAGKGSFDAEGVAVELKNWYKSGPIDIGNTTVIALSAGASKGVSLSEAMRRQARDNAYESQANGSLMRHTPAGVFGYRLPVEQSVALSRYISAYTHVNPIIMDACAAYGLAINHLVAHQGDAEGAFDRAYTWAKEEAHKDVVLWLDEAKANTKVPYSPKIGWARIAFTHTFRHLLLRTPYADAMRETLAGGGDTDTNAAIVGGVLGALCGMNGIRAEWVDTVRQSEPARPRFLSASQVDDLVDIVLNYAPESVAVPSS